MAKSSKPRLLYDLNDFRRDKCFLCGIRLRGSDRSDEHVFPKWLLHAAGLWNQRLTLLNETGIFYRNLVIPCCKQCNNEHLSGFEKELERACRGGVSALLRIEPTFIWAWCCKIMIGLLIRETALAGRQRYPKGQRIASKELLVQFWTTHHFLQVLRLPFVFANFRLPASVFIVKTYKYRKQLLNFDLFHPVFLRGNAQTNELLHLHGFAIRFGSIGIIAVPDTGLFAQTTFQQVIAPFQHFPAHPFQFRELAAQAIYHRAKMVDPPRYTSNLTGLPCIVKWENPPGDNQPVWGDWNKAEYDSFLLWALAQTGYGTDFFKSLFPEGSPRTGTFLINEEGYPHILTPNGYPSKAASVRKWLDEHKELWAVMPKVFHDRTSPNAAETPTPTAEAPPTDQESDKSI